MLKHTVKDLRIRSGLEGIDASDNVGFEAVWKDARAFVIRHSIDVPEPNEVYSVRSAGRRQVYQKRMEEFLIDYSLPRKASISLTNVAHYARITTATI